MSYLVQKADTARLSPFILDSWLKSFRKSRKAGVVPNNLYTPVYTETIRQLLSRCAQVLTAVDQILGWLCHERTSDGQPVVHYAFVKSRYRRRGILRSLLTAAGIDPAQRFYYTFGTPASRIYPEGRHCPEIARRAVA